MSLVNRFGGYDDVAHATVMLIKSCNCHHAYQLERELLGEKRENDEERSRERKKTTSEEPYHMTVHTYTSTHPHPHTRS